MKKVLIGGGSGLVGSRLIELLNPDQYDVYVLTRTIKSARNCKQIEWNPTSGHIALEGLQPDIIINLTGAGIADKLWTDKRKKEIIDSRVKSTWIFENLIAEKKINPECFISASAIGIYGDRGEEILTETSASGDKEAFMVHCCQLWEFAVDQIKAHMERVIKLRIGIVISTKGGALGKLSLSAKMGAAGYFGSGEQYMPWIHIDDLCNVILQSIENKNMNDVYNAVSPTPTQAKTFMQQLKKHYRSWALVLPIPAIFIKTAMGEMSAMMLNSTRVVPERLKEAGFKFQFEDLTEAIADVEARGV